MLVKKQSPIHGSGTFTNCSISSGQVIYQIPTDHISQEAHSRWARIGSKYINDEKVLNFINHSCDPNARINIEKCCIISLQDISIGDEITVDYNKTELDGEVTPCNCHSKKCKGYFKREI